MMTRKPLGRPLGDTEYLLEQWGWWRLDGKGVPTCISPSYAIIRDNVGVPKTLDYRITDDVAVMVDHAVARLTARNQLMGDLIWLYYGEKWPALKIGRRNNIGEAKARELIKTGVGWIDAKLENLTQAA